MGTLVIEDVDDGLMGDLVRLAAMNHLPIAVQAKRLLRHAVPRPDPASLIALLESIASLTPPGIPQTDSTLLIREERDR